MTRGRRKRRPELAELQSGILAGDRILLSRAITLIESKLPADQKEATELLDWAIQKSGNSIRIGITGVPGVGKSTFIEAFGKYLTKMDKKVAVLSIDPSSSMSKGSILGDKTRMTHLSQDPKAFIRPSPAGSALGGVAQKTREAIILCEAAGFEVILVETVGVGQSETAVKDMVDFFLLLMLAGGGDELQGIKRGIMEIADLLLINKADGGNIKAANQAVKAYQNALHLFPPKESGWTVPVSRISSTQNEGITALWETVKDFQSQTIENEFFKKQRVEQNEKWLHKLIREKLETSFFSNADNQQKIKEITKKVTAGKLSVRHAVQQIFN